MEKSKYADVALIIALLSLISPILSILTSQGIITKIAILGTFVVSGTGLVGLILGILGYKETEHKWKSIAAIGIYLLGTIIYFTFGYVVLTEVLTDLMSGLVPYP